MKNIWLAVAILSALSFSSCTRQQSSTNVADVVIRNARVYTVDKDRPWAQAVATRGDRIIWVGSDNEAQKYIATSTKVIDAGGRMMLPGFIDSHLHVKIGGGANVLRISNANTLAEIQNQVREFSERHPDLKWIEADGWNYSAFPNGTLPTSADLIGLTGGRPAFLVAYDYHTIWMNREALREFGVTRATDKVIFRGKSREGSEEGRADRDSDRVWKHRTLGGF